jgi:sugar-specific transcriptional regulator TrmB
VNYVTHEWLLKKLLDFGFKQQDAEVYVFLAENGPQEAKVITDNLKTYRRQVYRSLNRLKHQHFVTATTELPARFSAIPFDQVLDLLVKTNVEEANRLEQEKEKIFSLWRRGIRDCRLT